jgi:hypothetical protein
MLLAKVERGLPKRPSDPDLVHKSFLYDPQRECDLPGFFGPRLA